MRNADADDSVVQRNRMWRGAVSVWLLLLVLPMVGVLVGFVGGAVASYVVPREFESTAVVQVVPVAGPEAMMMSGEAVTQVSRAQFFATEFEVIQARETLERVAGTLDLPARWSVAEDACVETLRGMIRVEQLRGTDLIAVRARSAVAEDARDVAEQVVTEYQERRNEKEQARMQKIMDAMDADLRKQQEVVEEKRKVLDTIVQAVGIPVHVLGSENATGRTAADIQKLAMQNLDELERERESLEIQVKQLRDLSHEELLGYAAGLQLPQNGVTIRYQEYRAELVKLNDLLDGGLADAHPKVIAQRVRVDVLRKDLDRAVRVLREILETQLNLVDSRLEKMRQVLAKHLAGSPARSVDEHDYVIAKRDYEEAVAVYQHQKLAHSERRIMSAIPKNPVTIHEKPRIGRNPVTPNVPLCLGGGALGGAALGFALALLIGLVGKLTKRAG